jgi:hypothetical protein
VPPAVSWTYPDFMRASLKDIEARTVDCQNCPVFMLCETGQGGTGWTCPKCKATGVYLDPPKDNGATMPDYLLVMDCAKHKFEVNKDSNSVKECGLCSGGVMEFEVINKGTKNFFVRTVHAKVTAEARQEMFKTAWDHWTKEYAEKPLPEDEKK